MNICAFFNNQGFIIAELIKKSEMEFSIKNPVAISSKNTSLSMHPLFHFVEEEEVTIKIDDIYYNQIFTPVIEIANEYRKLFGSGIVVSNTLPL